LNIIRGTFDQRKTRKTMTVYPFKWRGYGFLQGEKYVYCYETGCSKVVLAAWRRGRRTHAGFP
jgi:hypothetical protein